MKIQGLNKQNATTINAMAENARDMVREGRKLVISDLEEYHRLIGCGIRDFTVAAWRKYKASLEAVRHEEELAMDLSIIANLWNKTRFKVVDYSINDGNDIYDYTAFFLSSGERYKFERENLESGASLIVLSTCECTIDQLPEAVHDDFISELFSEWV